MLEQILQLQMAEAALRREEAGLRSVLVRCWGDPSEGMAKLSPSFAAFFAAALAAVRVTGTARLYLLRSGDWKQRTPLDAAVYAAALVEWRAPGAALPDVFVFDQGATVSPEAPPDQYGAPAGGARSGSSVGSRATAIQQLFRKQLLWRDGSVCVLCAATSELQAAHIVPRVAVEAKLEAAGLPDANVVSNGVILCISCHRLHDAFMWCVDASGRVRVADALKHDAELGSLWTERGAGALSLAQPSRSDKARWWPTASVWAADAASFDEARGERHRLADLRPFVCASVCRARFKTAGGLQRHACKGRSLGMLSFETPAFARSAAAAAAAAAGAGAEAEAEAEADSDGGASDAAWIEAGPG